MHLIEPLGFHFEDKALRRAGLDYHEFATVKRHVSLAAFKSQMPAAGIHALTKHATRSLYQTRFEPGDVLLFGAETSGLPPTVREEFPALDELRIPMREGIRSLNLANAVAVTLYEALRQCSPAWTQTPL